MICAVKIKYEYKHPKQLKYKIITNVYMIKVSSTIEIKNWSIIMDDSCL